MYYTVYEGGTTFRKQLVNERWLDKMHDYRPDSPSYVKQVVSHEGYSSWWDLDMLTNLHNVDFPTVQTAGILTISENIYNTFQLLT